MASNDSLFGFGMSTFPPAFDTEPPPMNATDESELTSDVAFSKPNDLEDWGDFSNFTSVDSVDNNSNSWASFTSPPLTPLGPSDDANSKTDQFILQTDTENTEIDLNNVTEDKNITENTFDTVTFHNEVNSLNNSNLSNGSYIANTNDDFLQSTEPIKNGFVNIMFKENDELVDKFPQINDIGNNSEIDISEKNDEFVDKFPQINDTGNNCEIDISEKNDELVDKFPQINDIGNNSKIDIIEKNDDEFTDFQESNVGIKSEDAFQAVGSKHSILIDNDIETVSNEHGDQQSIEDGEYAIQNLSNGEESPPLLSHEGSIQDSINLDDEKEKQYVASFVQEPNCKNSSKFDDDLSKTIEDKPTGLYSQTNYSEERNDDLDDVDNNIDECTHDNMSTTGFAGVDNYVSESTSTDNLNELLGQDNGDIAIYGKSNTGFSINSDNLSENKLGELAETTDNNFDKLTGETYGVDFSDFNSGQGKGSSDFGIFGDFGSEQGDNDFDQFQDFKSVHKEIINAVVNFDVISSEQISDGEAIDILPEKKISIDSENLDSECNPILVENKTQFLVEEDNIENTTNIPDFIGQCAMHVSSEETEFSPCNFADFSEVAFEPCVTETKSADIKANFDNFDSFQVNETQMGDFVGDTENDIHQKLKLSLEHADKFNSNDEYDGFEDFGSFDSAPVNNTSNITVNSGDERLPKRLDEWVSSIGSEHLELQVYEIDCCLLFIVYRLFFKVITMNHIICEIVSPESRETK